MNARGPEELAALDERVTDLRLQRNRFASGQRLFCTTDRNDDRFTVRGYCDIFTVGELDQESGYSGSCMHT